MFSVPIYKIPKLKLENIYSVFQYCSLRISGSNISRPDGFLSQSLIDEARLLNLSIDRVIC